MEEKICSKCNISQPIENFNKHKRGKDGLNSECKSCVKIYMTARSKDPNVIEKRREKYKNITREQRDLNNLKKRSRKRKMTLEELIKEDNIVIEAEKLNMKYCYTCLRTLDKLCFSKMSTTKDGLNTVCKECRIVATRKYYRDNTKDITTKKKIYSKNNKEKILKRQIKYVNKKKQEDPMFHLSLNLRKRVKSYMKYVGISPKILKSTKDMIGCSPQELREHIESKFIDGMSWENYGTFGWHLDHITPLASAKDKEEIIKLNHYTNLQPLWAIDNLKKGGRMIDPPLILTS
jgi:hypothetical protein